MCVIERELSSVEVSTWRGVRWGPPTLSVSFACERAKVVGTGRCRVGSCDPEVYLLPPMVIRHDFTSVVIAATGGIALGWEAHAGFQFSFVKILL